MKKFLMGFVYAFNGIKASFDQVNMRVHAAISVLVLLAGWFLNISTIEWFVVIFLIGVVWAAELFNSAIENEADIMRDTLGAPYALMGRAKDLAAGAVLVISLAAAIIGLSIFVPKLLLLIESLLQAGQVPLEYRR